jgi:RNA polymerase sigma-70 factor (ECF subfamily)
MTAAVARARESADGEPVTSIDEECLLRGLRAGRPEASAELVRVHYQAVYRLLAHLTRDVHRAEDLTQETFITALEKIGGFQQKSSLGTWLHRIAYTKFVDAQRTRQRADGLRDRLGQSQARPVDPIEAVAADEGAKKLQRALDQLEESDRGLLVLHYLQGLSYREMSVVLDEPSGTVKWRTHLALARLRELLPDEVEDDALRRRSETRPVA